MKDLVDLVLLIESGLTADQAVAAAVRHVFAVRATHPVPDELPDPQPAWADSYRDAARGLTEASPSLEIAIDVVRRFWQAASHDSAGPGAPGGPPLE